jgi:hypothetical protein
MAIFYEMKLEEGGVKKNSRKGVVGKKKFIQTTTILCLSKHHCQVGRRGEERRGGGVRVLTTTKNYGISQVGSYCYLTC